ncbi:peptidase G1 [Butyriboletus roseoflavus]|nr:peptidase G1 [Butyriboletus roseoflavus]
MISPSVLVTATVAAENTTSGMAVIENHTTNQTVYMDLQGNSSTALCRGSAEWIVENYVEDGVRIPLANFSSVTFTDAFAIGPDGKKYTPSDHDAYIADIVQNNTILTCVAIDGDDITIHYIGNLFG